MKRKKKYKSPIVKHIDNETWERMKDDYKKRTISRQKEKEKHSK
jgi:hypothetical protein